ncbi:hypothetical protein [Corallococcus exiguus]|uniref:hypothetical protein n=1 Tax=Corallococcus exiguus TaxID=83462 RepID=UPI001C12FBB9|nr:hypothetical protein [Corallococcus exiguus]NRD48389.1 hypothetical protein [Corallococcus exiguus]
MTQDLAGKVILITGATDGIGKAASLKGEYVSKRRPVKPRNQALDPKLAAGLWMLSEQLCADASARVAIV